MPRSSQAPCATASAKDSATRAVAKCWSTRGDRLVGRSGESSRDRLGLSDALSFGVGVAARYRPAIVVLSDNEAWSFYGAPWLHPVATGRKWHRPRNRRNKRKPLPWIATMVRRSVAGASGR